MAVWLWVTDTKARFFCHWCFRNVIVVAANENHTEQKWNKCRFSQIALFFKVLNLGHKFSNQSPQLLFRWFLPFSDPSWGGGAGGRIGHQSLCVVSIWLLKRNHSSGRSKSAYIDRFTESSKRMTLTSCQVNRRIGNKENGDMLIILSVGKRSRAF